MNQHAKVDIRHSTCPHDCPSACALDIEVIDGRSIGRVRGSKVQTYTAGVVCAKVARYVNGEAIHANGGAYLGVWCMANAPLLRVCFPTKPLGDRGI